LTNLTETQWEEQYLPIDNPITNEGKSFETYGEELAYVLTHDNHNVWTEMDGDNGVYIVNGYHLVNRIQYYITDNPWNDEDDITITVCTFQDCNNAIEGECKPDCEMCGGDGALTVWGWENE